MTTAILATWTLAICLVAVFWPQRLLAVAIVCSVFEGASLLKVGEFAISPYYFTLLAVAARCVWIRTDANHLLGYTPRTRAVMQCALVFAGIAVAGACILPHVFAGWIVWSPRLDSDFASPLAFSASNLGQSLYLILNIVLLWYVAQEANSPSLRSDATNAFLLAGAVVIGFGLYEFAASLTGLPYPENILFSNDRYVMQYGSAVLGMPRICATFTEPAGLAVFLLGFTAFITSNYAGITRRPILRWTLLTGAVAVLILSTSSTAYLGLAAIAAWRIGTYIINPMLKGELNGRLIALVLVILTTVGATIAGNDTLRGIIQSAVFDKDQSSSFDQRSDEDVSSARLVVSTLGLGVGLGSNRGSSFLPSLLSTVGVLGAGAFAAVVILLLRRSAGSALMPGPHVALSAGLIGIIGAKVISSPDLSSPGMWVLMAGLLSIHSAVKVPRESAIASSQTPTPQFRPFNGVTSTGSI